MLPLISSLLSVGLLCYSIILYRRDRYFRALYMLVLSYVLPEVINGLTYTLFP